jgi:hypothetical protein
MFIEKLIERHGIAQVSRLGGPALKLLLGSFAPLAVIQLRAPFF